MSPDHVAADARGLPGRLRGPRRIRAHPRVPGLGQALGDVRERGSRGRAVGRTRARGRHRDGLSRDRHARVRRPAPPRTRHDGRGGRRAVTRFRRESGLIFTLDTLEFLARGGRIGRAAGWAGQPLHIKPILTLEDGEVLPLKRVRGNRKAIQEFAEAFRTATGDEPGLRVGIAHADAPERMAAVEKLVRDIRPNAEIEVATTLGPVVGNTPARARSGSSGSRTDADGGLRAPNQPSLASARKTRIIAGRYGQEAHVPPKEDDVSNSTTRRRSRGALALAAPIGAASSVTKLTGTVGPGFTITLKKGSRQGEDAQGRLVQDHRQSTSRTSTTST